MKAVQRTTKMKANQAGFTLIELMIVVAIIAILAAVAVPQYNDYTLRAKMSEVVLAAAPCKLEVSEVAQSENISTYTAWGCASATATSQYVKSVAVSSGVITVSVQGTSNAVLDAGSVVFTPKNSDGDTVTSEGSVYEWSCAPSSVALNKYFPTNCRAAAAE